LIGNPEHEMISYFSAFDDRPIFKKLALDSKTLENKELKK
jgi:hypothetical protein